MGTNEELVPGELLIMPPGLNCRVKQNFKISFQIKVINLNKKINEEIAYV